MIRHPWDIIRHFGTGKLKPNKGQPVVSDRDYWSWVGERWLPFVAELRAELRAVEARASLGFADTEHLPDEARILEWGRRAIALTEEVRGHGNGTPNVVYQALMRMGQYNGVARYRFEQVPTAWSLDGFVRVIDGEVRSSLYQGRAGGSSSRHKLGVAVDVHGELRQTVEESAIANTFISGVMSTRDAHVLIVGALLRRLLLRVVRRRGLAVLYAMAGAAEGKTQELLLRLAAKDSLPSEADAAAGRTLFRGVDAALRGAQESAELGALAHAYRCVGVGRDSAAWRAMLLWGVPPQSYGQLAPETKTQAARFVEAAIDGLRSKGQESLDLQIAEFVEFLREHPGSLWQGNRDKHLLMLSVGFLSNRIVYMSRDEIDRRTRHRYLPVRWTRALPLLEGECDGKPPVVKRTAGTEEISRFRFNAFPYDDEHGIGVGKPAGWEPDALDPLRQERERRRSTLHRVRSAAHLGEALVVDAGAKLGNWFMCDIEKILAEFMILNMRGTRGSRHRLLPGEAPVMVGQNPRAASSIGATQHTQLCTASVGKWPLLGLRAPAALSRQGGTRPLGARVKAEVELVQVGQLADSVMLRLELAEVGQVCHLEVLQLLHGAHEALMTAFGGRAVDFNVLAVAKLPQTGAVVTLTPVAMLVPVQADVWLNPDTGERSDTYGLPVQTIDFSQARGNWMTFGREAWAKAQERGREQMEALFDFARKPGARELLARFLAGRLPGWVDAPGQAELEPHSAAVHQSADAFWNAGRRVQPGQDMSRL